MRKRKRKKKLKTLEEMPAEEAPKWMICQLMTLPKTKGHESDYARRRADAGEMPEMTPEAAEAIVDLAASIEASGPPLKGEAEVEYAKPVGDVEDEDEVEDLEESDKPRSRMLRKVISPKISKRTMSLMSSPD